MRKIEVFYLKRYIIVWHNLNNDTYYYRFVTGLWGTYDIDYVNQYNHKIILKIDLHNLIPPKEALKTKVIKRIISFLQKKIN